MRATIHPGGVVDREVRVPADKSIAHRWLILAATGHGRSELRGLSPALDVRSTARVLGGIAPDAVRVPLEAWASEPGPPDEGDRSTSNKDEPRGGEVALEGEGRVALHAPNGPLDCGNSGTSMRLIAGVVAGFGFETVLEGDASLSARPMERVAEPLRAMGATVDTTEGHAPVVVRGAALRGIAFEPPVPSAQVKGAVLLAGLAAEGRTSVHELVATRDHTERALRHLGAPVRADGATVSIEPYQHEGFSARVPGDLSSAAFMVAAAVLGGAGLVVRDVGLNPSRVHLLQVLGRMGVTVRTRVEREELGEPVGVLEVDPSAGLVGTTVTEDELPLLIDEIPVLALLAACARGETWFLGAAELRVKETDRLRSIEGAIRALGGDAGAEGADLVVAGGGLRGGVASSGGDHRMAMALAVVALASREPVTVEGVEAAEVSFPGFLGTLRSLGARIEP